jgi:LysM repeat protein
LSAEAVALISAGIAASTVVVVYHEDISEAGREVVDAIHDGITYERPENYYPTDWKYYDAARNPNNPMFDPNKMSKWAKIVLGTGLAADLTKHLIEDVKVNVPKSNNKNIQVEIKSLDSEQSIDDILNDVVTVKVKYDINYKVQEGDNLSKIAEQYNTTVDELVKMNQIKDKDYIKAGETLKVGTGEYTTKTDDFEYVKE